MPAWLSGVSCVCHALTEHQPDAEPAQVELPTVSVQDGLLSARALAPPTATAGIAFPYTLQLQNFTGTPQDVQVCA